MTVGWEDYVGIMDFDNVVLIDYHICMTFSPRRRESDLLFVLYILWCPNPNIS
jgi:hypothetical protein